MSSADPTHDTSVVPPALEPPVARFDAHRRSFASLRVISALVLREMSTTYGRSPGGYIWAFLEPVAMIMVLSLGFALLMRSPSLGNSFILFYASGYLVYTQFRVIEKAVSQSIKFSRQLLFYPAVTWLDAVIARFILNFFTNLLNTILILGGILYFTDPGTVLDFGPMVEAMAMASLLGLGVGTFNCMMTGLFDMWKTAWKIVTRPLMLASAVLYVLEDMPSQVGEVLWWNPLAHLTGLFRTGIFPTYYPQYISPTYVIVIGLVFLVFGLYFLSTYHSHILNKK